MTLRVVVTCETFVDVKGIIESAGDIEVEILEPFTEHEPYVEALKDADGALVATWPLTGRDVLEACPKLKVVSRMGVGVDSIDLDAATELGVLACNVPGVNTVEVADHAMAMLLAILRRIPETVQASRDGKWSDDPALMREFQETVDRVGGKTVGILGFGNIGRAFAQRIRGFGPKRIIAFDPYGYQSQADLYGVQLVELDELLAESDIISIHSPHTAATDHIINAETLAKMKSTAILLNCARGKIVDQVALHAALRDGQIAFAGIDVTEVEPVASEDPILTLPNIYVTPHLAGYSPTFLEECGQKQAENVSFSLTGRAPHGLTNPDVIKTIAVQRAGDGGRWANVPDFSTSLPF